MAKMTTIFTLFLVVFLASSVFAQQIPQEIPTQPKEKPTIAVTTFENLSAYPENTWVAMSFSEALTVKLKRLYERFRVVERLRVYEVIKEQGFDPEKVDRLEVATQREMGSLIGANFLILGSVSLQGLADEPKTKLLANMRTVDVRTGEIKEATSVSGQMQEIFDLEIQLAFAFLKQVGADITAVEEQQISIKETESLLAEKYYNLGNQYFYDGNLDAAEAWYERAVELLEGGYYREAALRRVDVLRQQKAAAKDAEGKRKIDEKAQRRISVIEQRQAEADEMYFEKAELHMVREEYALALDAYQKYMERFKPWSLVRWNVDQQDVFGIASHRDMVYVQEFRVNPESLMQITEEMFEMTLPGQTRLSALKAKTGEVLWQFEVESQMNNSFLFFDCYFIPASSFIPAPIVTDDTVYCADERALYALSVQDGKLKWQTPLRFKKLTYVGGMSMLPFPETSLTSFILSERLLLMIKAPTGSISAFSQEKGALQWNFEREVWNLEREVPQYIHTVLMEGVLYVGSTNELSALDVETGEQLWYVHIEVKTPPILVNETLYVGTSEGIYALHPGSGKLLGQHLINQRIDALIGNAESIYAVSNSSLYALSRETGEIRWKSEVSLPAYLALANGRLYTIKAQNLTALEPATGELLWEYQLESHPFMPNQPVQPVLLGHSFYIKTVGGLYNLSSKTGEILWKFVGYVGITDGIYTAVDGTTYFSPFFESLYALNPKPEEVHPGAEGAEVLLGIGRAHIGLKQYKVALKPLEEAIKAQGSVGVAEAYLLLALAHEGLGDRTQAISNWEEYLVCLDMSGAKLLEAREKAAKQALKQFEPSFASAVGGIHSFYKLGDLAKAAFKAGDMKKASEYAIELLNKAAKHKDDWNYGNAVHDGNLILGRVALKSGDLEKAKEYLIEAGKTPGSPQLNSFGPNMTLTKELLEKGEREVVIKYFQLCANFWEMGEDNLKNWISIVKEGGIPDFGANLEY